MLCWTVHQKGPRGALHAAVALRHKVYSFGGYGYTNDGNQISVHIFNTVSLCWTRLSPVTTGGGERPPPEIPSHRVALTAVLIEDVVYIWGGLVNYWIQEASNGELTIYGDHCNILYAFDVETHRWFKPDVSGTVPEGRSVHSACVLGKVMYIFGGQKNQEIAFNDIYMLDTFTMGWSLIDTKGTPAPVSLGHSATIIGTKIFVFGGRWGMDHFRNINAFDTETNCWLSTPSAQLLPEGRMYHSALAYNGELYILGGDNCPLDQTFNDMWKFNPQTFSWKKINPKGKGPPRMHRMCCCMVDDCIILFGGKRTPDDLYILDLSTSLKTLCKLAVIQRRLEQSGLPHDIRWEMAAMTTNSNRNM